MQTQAWQLRIILLIVFIGFVGTSIAYPLFAPLFLHPEQGSIIPAAWGSHGRSIFLGIALAAYPLGQFIGSPILGSYSDRFGRKPILMASLIGSALGYLLTALALKLNGIVLLLASRLLTGILESNFGIVRAMAVDLTGISKYKSIGKINAAASIGFVMGPLIGGFFSDNTIVSWFSFILPFLLAALFSVIALLLAYTKLPDKKPARAHIEVSWLQQLNIMRRFIALLKHYPALTYLLLIATLYTFSVDMFYEFGPVYLTGLWAMTPIGIAIYNVGLSLGLGFGHAWFSHILSTSFTTEKITVTGILLTAIFFGILVIFHSKWLAFIFFTLAGLSISISITHITTQISNSVDSTVQGEVMGTQLSLRMLGDAILCLAGGIVIISSVLMPMAIASLIAFSGYLIYFWKYCRL